MPGLKYAPFVGQPATHFSLAEIVACNNDDLGRLHDRIVELASSQDLPVMPDWFKTAKFVLADRDQVESRVWCSMVRPAVAISCVGNHTEPYSYGFEPSDEVVTPNIPVCYDALRDSRLKLCLWDIVKALSQGRAVVVHCNQSFHRGPCGLMAILKTLLDTPVAATKDTWSSESFVLVFPGTAANSARHHHPSHKLGIIGHYLQLFLQNNERMENGRTATATVATGTGKKVSNVHSFLSSSSFPHCYFHSFTYATPTTMGRKMGERQQQRWQQGQEKR